MPKLLLTQQGNPMNNVEAYDHNTLGFRLISSLIHQYFITGGKKASDKKTKKKMTLAKKMKLTS